MQRTRPGACAEAVGGAGNLSCCGAAAGAELVEAPGRLGGQGGLQAGGDDAPALLMLSNVQLHQASALRFGKLEQELVLVHQVVLENWRVQPAARQQQGVLDLHCSC